jgi:co-chaperonin GroES (HSP10)
VEVDESLPETSLFIPIRTDKWTGKDNAIESYGRGKVVLCGPGKRNQKTGRPERMVFTSAQGIRPVQEGDVIRFSELEYPEHKEDGKRYALITEGDIVGVEA